jgi:anti-sigma B factor antagonist
MKIQEVKKGAITIFELDGRLDSVTSGQLEKSLLAGMQAGVKYIIIYFSKVDYISSAGLRVLLMAAKKSKTAGGEVVLAALINNVKEVFDIAGFTAIFQIFAAQDEALASFTK